MFQRFVKTSLATSDLINPFFSEKRRECNSPFYPSIHVSLFSGWDWSHTHREQWNKKPDKKGIVDVVTCETPSWSGDSVNVNTGSVSLCQLGVSPSSPPPHQAPDFSGFVILFSTIKGKAKSRQMLVNNLRPEYMKKVYWRCPVFRIMR